MDNQDQTIGQSIAPKDGIGVQGDSNLEANSLKGVETGALSYDPMSAESYGGVSAAPLTLQEPLVKRMLRRVDLVLLALLVLGATALVISGMVKDKQTAQQLGVGADFGTVHLPLDEFLKTQNGIDIDLGTVVINGELKLNNKVVIAPSVQPNAPTAGQLYFDQNTNQLAYYSGSQFVPLNAASPDAAGDVDGVGGLTGQIALGGGLNAAAGRLNNTGVLSLQGQTGNIAFGAGNGIAIAGTTISNTGVVSVVSGSPSLVVTNDGSGNVTVTNVGAGSGTVTSAGGTNGTLPLFTGAQNIENSIVTQSGGTITVGGDLSVTGAVSLGTDLSVANGGTGLSSLTANGVLVGNGAAAISSVAAGGSGLCFMSTAGAPAWSACPGGSGVSSVNGLTGALTITNSSGIGTTITIDDATTAAKGIASFNSTNFTVTSGAVNTVQNINSAATPTFAGVNTSTITPTGALTIAGTANLLVQGGAGTFGTLTQSGSLVLSDGSSNTATIVISGHAANRAYTIPDTGVDADFCLSTGNCVGGGTGGAPNAAEYLVASLSGTLTNERALASGTNVSITDGGANGNMTVATVNNPSFSASVTTPVLQSSGALTISSAAGTTVALDAGTTIELQDSANVSGNIDISGTFTSGTGNAFQISAAGAITAATGLASSGAITFSGLNCTGNANGGALTTNGSGQLICSDDDGGAGGAISGSGTSGTVPLFNGTQTITDSIITQSGTTITIAGDLTLNTDLSVGNGGTGASSFTSNGIIYGNGAGALQVSAAGTGGQILVADASGVPTFMTMSGDVTVSNTGIAAIQANSVALGTDTTGGYMASLGSLTGLSTTGNSGEGSTPTLSVTYGSGANTAVQGNTSLTCPSGTGNLTGGGTSITLGTGGSCAAIDTVANPTFSTSVTTPLLQSTGTMTITPGGALTIGATNQSFTVQGSASSVITATNSGFTTTVGFTGTPTGGVRYNFDQAATPGTYSICTSAGNCSAGGNVSTVAGTTNRLAKFTGATTIGDSIISDDGTTVSIAGNLAFLQGQARTVSIAQASSGAGNDLSVTAGGGSGVGTGGAGGALTLAGGNAAGSGNNDGGNVLIQGGAPINTGFGGQVTVRNLADTTSAFMVQNAAASSTVLNVDTVNGRVGVGGVASFSKFEVLGGDAAVYNSGSNPRLVLGDSTTFGQNGYLQWDSAGDYFRIETVGTNGVKIKDNYVAIGNIAPSQPLIVGNGSTNLFQVDTNGTTTLIGGQAVDMTTPSAATASGLTIQPGASTGASSNGPATTVKGGDASGTTSVTAGAVTIQGGNATGSSGTRNGGNVSIDGGTGATANGSITVGTANAVTVTVGRVASTTTLYGTVQVATLSPVAAASQTVCRDVATGKLTTCDANQDSLPFVQGGNTLGAQATLGTNDTNNLAFKTSNITRALFDQSNNLYLGLGVTNAAPTAFTVQSTGSSTAGTAGALMTIQGGAGATTGAGSAGGGLTLAGGNSVGGAGNNAGGIVTLQGGSGTNSGAPGYVLVKNSANSATAFTVQDASSASLFTVDTTARSGSGGNLIKIGNSTGTDTATTILQLDSASANPTTNLAALNGGLFYHSGNNKVSIIENGVVKELCNTTDLGCSAGGASRLDQITAANTNASINNGANNIVWNWQLTAAELGMNFAENSASTGGGTQNQFILQASTLSGSTASPMRILSNSADGGDVVFNLNGSGDLEFQDAGTAFLTLSDAGAITIDLDATDDPPFRINNNGDGEVGIYQTTGSFRIYDNSTISFAVDSNGNVSLGKVASGAYVTVGDATGQPSPNLFVLDNKGTSGDPTSVYNGAMYYNSIMGVMRCYIDDTWQHCNSQARMSSGYNVQEEFIGADPGSNNGQGWTCGSGTVGMGTTHSWNCNGTGSDSTVASVTADTYQRPGQLQLSTGTGTTNSIITYLGGGNGGSPFFIGGGETFETAINIPTLSNGTQRYIARFGLCDATENHNVDCTNGVYFEYDSNTSANWRYATATASTRTKNSSTKAVATGWTNLKWVATSSGNVNFYVKSAGETTYTLIGSNTANIPTSTGNATRIMYELDKFAGGTARTFTIDYMDYWNDLTAKR